MRLLWLAHVFGFLIRTLLWTVFTAVVLLWSAQFHLQLTLAHRIARELTTKFVTGEIRGELRIGSIDEIELDHIVVHGAELYDGEGRRIITGERVELEPDFLKLFRGLLRFRVGRLTGGTVRLVNNADDQPSLFTTFDPRDGSPSSADPLRALVDDLIVEDVTLYGQLIKVEGIRAEHVYARGALMVDHGVNVRVEGARGELVQPYDFVGRIDNLSGTISSEPARGVKLDVSGKRDDEEVHGRIEYRSSAPSLPQELDLQLFSEHLTPDTLRRVGFAFAEPLAPSMKGQVQLSGPPGNLALNAHVESAAGTANVLGTVHETRGVVVQVSTDRIAIDKLVEGAPSVNAKGQLEITVATEPDAKPQVHAEIGSLRYAGFVVPAFTLDGELLDHGVRIDRARATQGGQIAVKGFVGWDGGSDLQVDARFNNVKRDPNLSRFADDLEGGLSASVHVRTPARDQPALLHMDGKLELTDANYGSVHAQRLVLTGKAHGDPSLPQLDVEVQADELQVLEYRLGNARFALHGGPQVYNARGEFEAKGQKTFSFDAKINADRGGFVVQAEPIEFTVGTESWRGAIRNLAVQHERSIELGFLRLASRAQRLEANGILRIKGEDSLHAQLQNFDLTALRAVLGDTFPLTFGYADASVELRGDVAEPELSLTGALRQATLGKLAGIDALYTVSYRDGHLELDTDVDLQERGTLQLLGQGELDASISDPLEALRSGLYNLTFSSSNLDLTLIPQLAGTVHSGRLQGKVDAQGGLDAITLEGSLGLRQLSASNWAPLQLDSTFKYNHDELDARLTVSDPLGRLARARGLWHIDWRTVVDRPLGYLAEQLSTQDFKLRVRTDKRGLNDLPFDVPWQSWPVQLESRLSLARKSGVVHGDGNVTLTPLQQLADPSCNISSRSQLDAQVQLTNAGATLRMQALLDERSVAMGNGKIDWPIARFLQGLAPEDKPQFQVNGQLQLDHLEQVPGLCRHGHGRMQADFDVRGAGSDTPSAALKLHAQVVPQSLSSNGLVTAPVQRCVHEPLELDGSLQGDATGLAFAAQAHGCSGGPADLQASIPWFWNATHVLPQVDTERETNVRLDLQDAELEPLLDYLPGVRGFSGKASGQLTAKARRGKVDTHGQVALTGGRLYLIPTGQELTDVSLILAANGNWLKLDKLTARVGHGTFQVAGGISLEGWLPRHMQLGLVMQELPIQREGLELAWLTGSAAVVGDIGATQSRTAVKLHALAVRLPKASSRSLQALEPHSDITLTHEQGRRPATQPYSFEFAVDGRNLFSARRNDFEASLTSELDVAYRDPDLHVGGYIEFRRGTFELFGKRFEVNRGSMHFDGTTELNPEISMVATYDPSVAAGAGGGQTVVVNVSGTLAKPQVEFFSERCPGEGAVVMLVSGRCPTEGDTGSGATSANATQNAFAAGIIGGILTLGAQRELGGLVPRLAVESSALGTRTRVKAGWEAVPPFMRSLVQRVYFQGAISTADQNASSTNTSATTPDFLLELYFPNNIVGAGRVAPTTRSWGVDVTWEP